MPAEKNDVDISALFNYGQEFELKIGDKTIPVYVRIIGDADLNRARVFAIRRSSEMRRKFKMPNSDEAIAYLPDITEYSTDLLIETIITLSAQEMTRKIINELDFPYPNELDSEATLEEQEKYQEEVDSYPTRRAEKIRVETLVLLEKLRTDLKSKSREFLESALKEKLISTFCEKEMLKIFNEICTFYGTYKDKNYKTRMFESFEQFENLIPDIKDQFLGFYETLEIDSEYLKK